LRPPFGTTLFGEIRPAPRLPRSFAASLAHLDRSATSQRWTSQDSPLSYAISHFYLNGGTTAWSVRVAEGAAAAAVRMQTAPGGVAALRAEATSSGGWGNNPRLAVDYATSNPATSFNLTVTELIDRGGTLMPARVVQFNV
jgi:hypothetical protein